MPFHNSSESGARIQPQWPFSKNSSKRRSILPAPEELKLCHSSLYMVLLCTSVAYNDNIWQPGQQIMQTDITLLMKYVNKQKTNSTATKLYSSDSSAVVYFCSSYERNMMAQLNVEMRLNKIRSMVKMSLLLLRIFKTSSHLLNSENSQILRTIFDTGTYGFGGWAS